MHWTPDRGLQLRMAASFVGLAVLYLAFIGALVYITDFLWILIVGLGVGITLQYYFATPLALRTIGASTVSDGERPDLQRRVTALAQQADVPVPELAVSDTEMPNAFATGRSPSNATVCVTTGLLDLLSGDELDAVLAHELSHIKNRDAMVLTVVSFLGTLTYFIVRHSFFVGGGGSGGGDSSNHYILAFFGISFVVWVGSYFVERLISRYREFTADRGAVAITGKPAALASALMRIEHEMANAPDDDLRTQAGLNALYIHPAETDSRVLRLMQTHPSTERRIDKLRTLTRDTAGSGAFETATGTGTGAETATDDPTMAETAK